MRWRMGLASETGLTCSPRHMESGRKSANTVHERRAGFRKRPVYTRAASDKGPAFETDRIHFRGRAARSRAADVGWLRHFEGKIDPSDPTAPVFPMALNVLIHDGKNRQEVASQFRRDPAVRRSFGLINYIEPAPGAKASSERLCDRPAAAGGFHGRVPAAPPFIIRLATRVYAVAYKPQRLVTRCVRLYGPPLHPRLTRGGCRQTMSSSVRASPCRVACPCAVKNRTRGFRGLGERNACRKQENRRERESEHEREGGGDREGERDRARTRGWGRQRGERERSSTNERVGETERERERSSTNEVGGGDRERERDENEREGGGDREREREDGEEGGGEGERERRDLR
ncbi:hypothetical protein EVAR_53233_1 [Eumeta japonica]|uniref:Uncharacterized protein n=1 Tax=Eumeta variegata TaxID=151549 RepID=A0A4C1XD10_EUMVA|nr:hypothetical protein EVAR_53233_1 [Eumeta japonica]